MAFTSGKTQIGKKILYVWLKRSSGETGAADFTSWVLVGVCSEKPTLKLPAGDAQKINDGTEPITSSNIEFEAEVLEVTAANYTSLRSIINCNIDAALSPVATGFNDSPLTAGSVLAKSINIYAEPNITGNDQNKILLHGKKEIPVSDAVSFTMA